MNATDVECPICGTLNEKLDLDETDGWMECEELAEGLDSLMTYGKSKVAFVIGGSLGLHDEVLQRADEKLCFGRMTLPHQLMKLVLVEQIYRSFRIMKNEPYHK